MRRILTLVAALGLVAAGCSKGSEGEPKTTAPVRLPGTVSIHGEATLSGDKPSVTVQTADDYFEPTFLKASPGAVVSVEVRSTGIHSHTFTIESLNIDQMLAPGETKRLAFTLPSSLGARFFCRFHGPTGMQGAFYFNAGSTFGTTTPTTTASDEPVRY